MRVTIISSLLALAAPALYAQGSSPAVPAAASVVPPAAVQIAAAVLPLPEPMRAGARVWGYAPDGALVELRPGTGSMTCIADNPREDQFHVACYHNAMEPYMARGRELRAQGLGRNAADSTRTADVRAGRIRLPATAGLYSLTGPATSYDPATNTTSGANRLYVIYVPFATTESLGITTTPARGQPWLMHGGQPGAHIMFSPGM